jgi:hypothetical protein
MIEERAGKPMSQYTTFAENLLFSLRSFSTEQPQSTPAREPKRNDIALAEIVPARGMNRSAGLL